MEAVAPSPARSRARSLFSEIPEPPADAAVAPGAEQLAASQAGTWGDGDTVAAEPHGGAVPEAAAAAAAMHVSDHALAEIVESLSVQTFSAEQVAAMIAGTEPTQVSRAHRAQGGRGVPAEQTALLPRLAGVTRFCWV